MVPKIAVRSTCEEDGGGVVVQFVPARPAAPAARAEPPANASFLLTEQLRRDLPNIGRLVQPEIMDVLSCRAITGEECARLVAAIVTRLDQLQLSDATAARASEVEHHRVRLIDQMLPSDPRYCGYTEFAGPFRRQMCPTDSNVEDYLRSERWLKTAVVVICVYLCVKPQLEAPERARW